MSQNTCTECHKIQAQNVTKYMHITSQNTCTECHKIYVQNVAKYIHIKSQNTCTECHNMAICLSRGLPKNKCDRSLGHFPVLYLPWSNFNFESYLLLKCCIKIYQSLKSPKSLINKLKIFFFFQIIQSPNLQSHIQYNYKSPNHLINDHLIS